MGFAIGSTVVSTLWRVIAIVATRCSTLPRRKAHSRRPDALLAAGADPNTVDGHGNGPLWTAVYNDRDGQVIELLLEAGADPLHANGAGATPVSLARTIGGVTGERFAEYR